MKFGGAAVRPAYYDRNGVGRSSEYTAGGVAPHASTQRWLYTVPAGKLAVIFSMVTQVIRLTAAAPVGRAEARIDINDITVCIASLRTNAVGDQQSKVVGSQIFAIAGQEVAGYTYDTSTGGTVDYDVSVRMIEFDA